MFTSFLIMFRESLEASLIVGILLGYLLKTKQTKYNNLVYLSIGAGIAASIGFAVLFNAVAGGFEGLLEQVFEGITMVVAAILLTFMILWMMKQQKIALKFHAKMQEKIDSGKMFGLFMIGFVSILREGVETVIFLNAASYTEGANFMLGAFLGVGVAIALGYLVFVGAMKINLKAFFNGTSILLTLFAAGLFAHGIHEFQEAGILPFLGMQAWDINPEVAVEGMFPVMHESGAVGSILKGLFGYNGNPTVLEVLVYFAYILGIWMAYRKVMEGLTSKKSGVKG